MGVFHLQHVTDWQGASKRERQDLLRNPDEAGPIGRRGPRPTAHTATRIGLNPASGGLTYGPEIKIEVYRGQEKLLPEDLSLKLGMGEIRGWLFQVREAGPHRQPDSFACLKGKEILLSKLPHSRNYFVRRTLKPCKHEKAVWKQIARAWDKHADIRLMDERLDHIFQELSVTPFVSFKGCLAAWALTPKRFDALGAERFDTEDDYTIATLDMPLDQACEWLKIDPAVQSALAATRDGTLFIGYRTAQERATAIRHGVRPPNGPIARPVTEELRKHSAELMEAACWAALSGRERPAIEDSVAQRAVLLYHRFAYNFVDREKDETETGGSSGEQPAKGEYAEQWRKLGYDRAFIGIRSLIDHMLGPEVGRVSEASATALRPAFYGWPSEWKRPEGFREALQRIEKLCE